ncbi:Uncharacterised protein [uncultured archaeon]|nr:Uncharacterised protein [uncultured archaeon]
MRKIKSVLADNKGVSEIIGALLILLILVTFLGILQSQFVPAWNKEIEASHFNTVLDDVLNIKQVLLDTAVYDVPRTIVFHASLDYPARMFLTNPLKPSATITTYNDKQINIIYNGGTNENITSCTIKIKENYNYFSAPALIIEHGMIIGDTGAINYIVDDPLLNKNNIDLLIVNCSNTSLGTTSSTSFHLYPVLSNEIPVDSASISFKPDYPALWSTYLASIQANWTMSGNIITMNYNSSTKIRILGTSINTPSTLDLLSTSTPTLTPTPHPTDFDEHDH